MELIEKEVYFSQYCKTCKHAKTSEDKDPCNECLTYPSNESTHRPVKYEEAANNGNNNDRLGRTRDCNC